MTEYQAKLRRLAEKGLIRTPETHPDEYDAWLNSGTTQLRQLEEIAKEYMFGAPFEDEFEFALEDDYGDESFA